MIVFVVSIFFGRYPKPFFLSPQQMMQDETAIRLVGRLRLPRLVAAVLLGMTLAGAGTVFQMIFNNPLVDPGFLGVSQGAAFGAAFCLICLGNAAWLVQVSAASFACLGLAMSYFLAWRMRLGGWVLRLVLAGISVSAIFSSGLGIMKYFADPMKQLPEITFWLLGGLWSVTWTDLGHVVPVVVPALIVLFLMRWRLNLLSLDEVTSYSLGSSPQKERALLLGSAVVATSAMVSISGMVGWVGLIVPHVTRRMMGADARVALPGAMLLGGLLVVLCDDLARGLMMGEIPLGILTSLFGAGFFLVLVTTGNPK
jgi:iron complex transport system permease protein